MVKQKSAGVTAKPPKNAPKTGSFFEHLEELAIRVRNIAIILLVFSGVGLFFGESILTILIAPYGDRLTVLGPTEGISTLIKVGLTIGVALSSPFILFQIIAFVAPGLEPHEKRPLFFVIPASLILFVVGAAFAWFILVPSAINFLATFGLNLFNVEWTADRYIPFVLSLVLWIGVSFEMPLLFMFLGRIGIVSPRLLLRAWRIAIVIIAVIAAAITPTVDPFNMMLVMGPLIGLYFLSIIGTAFTYKKRDVAVTP
jgi:sec-independent protein translocase protein TatC